MKILMGIKSKRIIFWLACFVIVALLTYTYVYLKTKQSEPYQISEQFLLKNNDVIKNLGEPVKLTMNIFGGYYLQFYADSEAKAKFKISIYGTKNKGKAVIELKRREGTWQITKADLFLRNDKQIKLKEIRE